MPGGAKQRETQSAEQVTADVSLWQRAGERGVHKRYRPSQYSGRAVQRPDRVKGNLTLAGTLKGKNALENT